MLFNSLEFLFFAIFFFLIWPLCRKQNTLRWLWIIIGSFTFYAWWDWRFLFLIITSGCIDYLSAWGMVKAPKWRRTLLLTSLVGNLGLLSIFKYSKFFAGILDSCFEYLGMTMRLTDNIPEFVLILPVGISFYTFQSLSYTIDVYRGKLRITKNILHFFSYLVMFPQLVAGPIVRAKDLLHQLSTYRIPSALEKWNAFKLIIYGLTQKMLIADNLAYFIDSAFEGKTEFAGSPYWWLVIIAFSFQIYYDFSGYSLVAKGLAKYMGYHFRSNFNHPYLAHSLRNFWRRWHISLSTWFRDYVYIPMGGSRKGQIRLVVALATTMLLSGLWHGANFTFLMWASIHIAFLLFEKFTKWYRFTPKLIAILFVYFQVLIAWVYFRAENIEQGNTIVSYLFSFDSSDLNFFSFYYDNLIFLYLAVVLECLIGLKLYGRLKGIWRFYKRYDLDVVVMILCLLGIVFFRGEGQQFIYFQF
ncbi:MAG: hypothetical protein MK212_14665 [Saprospiraceae bacterium]|nr:hypothetical protein [Saprospiraceae bacterium]